MIKFSLKNPRYIFLFLLLFCLTAVGVDFLRARVLSINIKNQTIDKEVVVSKINIPSYGFAQLVSYDQSKNDDIVLGISQFLPEGSYSDVKIPIIEDSKSKIDPQSRLTIKLYSDTSGDRVLDLQNDTQIKSLFGFYYQKDFFNK